MSIDRTVEPQSHNEPPSHSGAPREALAHHAWAMLVGGGLLWVATYAVEILIGVRLGEAAYADPDVSSSWLVWLWPATFVAATFCLAAGLLGLAARIRGRGRVLAAIGACVALVGLAASTTNLIRLTGVTGETTASNGLGFLGVIGVLGGSVLLGVATLRAKILPRWVRLTLALLPLAFIPGIIATIPLESVAPDYVVADLPFPIVGLILAAVGIAVHQQPAAR